MAKTGQSPVESVERPKWQLPPDAWYAAMPANHSLRDWMEEYYKRYPGHRPPSEWLERVRQLPRPLTDVERCLREARLGNPAALISRLKQGSELAPRERAYLVELLEREAGERYRDMLREVEWFLIASQVERRVREGEKQESVILDVMEQHDWSRVTVFKALRAYRSKYGSD